MTAGSSRRHSPIGEIPSDWGVVPLRKLVERERGIRYGIVQPGKHDPDGRAMIRGQDYSDGWVRLDEIFRVGPRIEAVYRNARVKGGDILITIVGASTGHVATVPSWLEGANLTQTTARVAIDDNMADRHFCFFALQGKIGQLQTAQYIKGGAQPGLNCGDVEKFLIPLPPDRQEQRAIAAALSDADALIAALDTMIAKKRAMKQGAMQQLLTGRTRLPGFDGIWRQTTLGALGSFFKGRGIKADEVTDAGASCIRYGELYTRYRNYLTTTVSHVSPATAAQSVPIAKGDIMFAASGETSEEIGTCAAYVGDADAYVGGDVIVHRPVNQDSIFLAHLFNSPPVAAQKARLCHGEVIVHINASSLAAIRFEVPEVGEQRAVATVLTDMDAEIAALELQREKARAIKQGMMQSLLTGRVRLVGATEGAKT
ncbi:MAG: restriction endonuclease subunit S [Thermoplasmatota archaeon]